MHHVSNALEFPSHLNPLYKKAIRYEWISLLYVLSASVFSFLALSNSQTMKTVWLEDLLGIIPPASFLISSKIICWNPNKNFPYGYHRVTSAAYLTSSLALFILGAYLLIDGLFVLLQQEHASIPDVYIGRHPIWFGYFMIIALLWSSIPSTFLGHIKLPLAYKLHDRILLADSKMNKASWMSGFASIIGVIGIGFGFWWADALVGMIISIDILKDGFTHVKQAVFNLLNETPKSLKNSKTDVLIAELKSLIKKEEWVESVSLRFREEGHILFGEVFINPNKKSVSINAIDTLHEKIKKHHWRVHDVVLMVTSTPSSSP